MGLFASAKPLSLPPPPLSRTFVSIPSGRKFRLGASATNSYRISGGNYKSLEKLELADQPPRANRGLPISTRTHTHTHTLRSSSRFFFSCELANDRFVTRFREEWFMAFFLNAIKNIDDVKRS